MQSSSSNLQQLKKQQLTCIIASGLERSLIKLSEWVSSSSKILEKLGISESWQGDCTAQFSKGGLLSIGETGGEDATNEHIPLPFSILPWPPGGVSPMPQLKL